MTPEIEAAMIEISAAAWPAFLLFLRVGAMMALFPGFGEQSVPARVKLAAAICFTLICFPALDLELVSPSALPERVLVASAEVLSGVILGLFVRLFVIALQTAGTIAAQSTTLSQIFGAGPGTEPQAVFGNVFLVAGLALATLAGLHVHLAKYIIGSYALFPIGVIGGGADVAAMGMATVAHVFALAFSIAAPFMIASLAYNVILGVINRAMPQLMVAFVGAPAITGAGLFLLFLTTPFLLEVWRTALLEFLSNPAGAAG